MQQLQPLVGRFTGTAQLQPDLRGDSSGHLPSIWPHLAVTAREIAEAAVGCASPRRV